MNTDPFGLRGLTWFDLARELDESGSNQDRQDAAWMEVFGRLRALALQWVRQPANAEEVASSIVAKMLERRGDPCGVLARIREAEQPQAYVGSIVRNETYRLREQESRAQYKQLPSMLESAEEEAVDEAMFSELRDSLVGRYAHLMDVGLSSGELTKADFDVLREWAHGTPAREMARNRRISESAMRKRIERAKQRYRRFFSGDASQVLGGKDFADELAKALERVAKRI